MGTKKALKDNTEGQYVGILRSHDRIGVCSEYISCWFYYSPTRNGARWYLLQRIGRTHMEYNQSHIIIQMSWDLVPIFQLAGRTMKISEFGDLCGILLGRLPPTSAHHHHHPWHHHNQHLQHHLHHHRYHYRFCFVGGRKSLLLHSQVLFIIV